MSDCPCDNCITRAICYNKDYRELLTCKLLRIYMRVEETGNIAVRELELFCKSMDLRLIKYRKSSIGHTSYYIEGHKIRSTVAAIPIADDTTEDGQYELSML